MAYFPNENFRVNDADTNVCHSSNVIDDIDNGIWYDTDLIEVNPLHGCTYNPLQPTTPSITTTTTNNVF